MQFPAYRKYSNGKSYFKIINPNSIEEVQVIGSYFTIHRLDAKILPERNLIADLLHSPNSHIQRITEQEFLSFLQECQQKLTEKVF